METKEHLINTIKEWVKIDNEIRMLQTEIRSRKASQKRISESLITIMKQNEIDCFDLNDGSISYNTKTVKKPITKGMLINILSKYYEGDFMKANEMNSFIMQNREEVTKETISRKINK
jgi:methyl coenzyme M reductase subunit C